MPRSASIRIGAALLSAGLLAACLLAGAEEPSSRTYARRATGRIYIDGNLTEPDWQRAEVVGTFLLQPQRTAEKDVTEARILWDDECLYIAFKCQDAHIAGTKTERNTAVFEDDCVEAFICPLPRNFQRYTNIEINAIGTYNSRVCGEKAVEGLAGRPGVTDPASPRAHWFPPGLQIGRSHLGTMNNDADRDSWWIIEMSIPFKSFEVLGWSRTPADGDVWRYNLYRLGGKVDPQRSGLFPLSDGANNHSPKDFGELVFKTATWPQPAAGPAPKGAAGRVFPHPFLPPGAADIPALKAATARLMEMPDGEIVRLIPELAPIRLVGCANCQGGSQDTSVNVWTIDDPDHIRCRYCGQVYPNERFPLDGVLEFVNPRGRRQAYRYHDGGNERKRYFYEGAIAAEACQYLAERAYDLARLYGATRDGAYARKAAVILDRFAQVYPGWPVHGNVGNYANWKTFHSAPPYPAQSGKWGRWIHDEFMTELALAYDLIRESDAFEGAGAGSGPAVRRRIETDLFRAQVELVRSYDRYVGASGQNGTAAGLIAIGRAIEEPDYVHDGVARFRDSFTEWFFADGLLVSGSPAYTLQMLSALESPAQMAKGYSDPPGYLHPGDGLHFERLDLGATSAALDRSRAVLASLRLPDGRYAPLHDSWARKPFTQGQPPRESRPVLLPAAGHAVLGRGAGAEQAQVHLHFGDHAGHAHADELTLGLFAHGREMLGEIGYSHTKLRPWAMSALAHNTVVVDRFNQAVTKGWLPLSWTRLDRFEESGPAPEEAVFGRLLAYDTEDARVQVVEAEAVRGSRAFVPGLKEYRRLVALVGLSPSDAYVVDVFRVTGGREHLWAAHGSVDREQKIDAGLALRPQDGTLLGPGTAYAAGRDPELDGESFKGAVFGLVDGLSSASTDGAWSAAWRYVDDPRLGLSLTMLGGAGRRVILGRAPSVVPAGEDNARVDDPRMPLLLVEDRNEESVFVAVWEPFRDRPRITAVRPLEFRGDAGRTVGLAVETAGRTDTILIDPDGDGMRITTDGLSFQGRFGLVSEERGKPLAMHLNGGTLLAKGRRELRGRPGPEGKLVGLRREAGKEYFETDIELAGAAGLKKRWLLHLRPDGRTRAYRILEVRTSGGRSLILPEGGTGLEAVRDPAGPGKYRDVYFPHSGFDGGLGTFRILEAAWTKD